MNREDERRILIALFITAFCASVSSSLGAYWPDLRFIGGLFCIIVVLLLHKWVVK